ncbi:TRAP transporter substrate-binding protein DctP [Microbacterium schleiferi]|uniref:TRAP transporter substrate-binding protein DctP n=1 Tax=Microbacterium schleiferi TaxID=69362 RepID=A0A7S8MZK0_9MICO|nr:TRAP transporter substrate-binding protein DctP [Microbacterium schleiferi]QPE05593.1 TRAP transporter substrate-binding protein DctP [Microbacterium schleiferi]
MKDHLRWPQSRAITTVAVGGLAAAMLLSGCASGPGSDASGDSSEPDVTLTVASFLLDGTPNADMVHWFLDTVEEESDGSITFDYFAAESLCPSSEIVQCVVDGRADMGVVPAAYTPDKFPLQNLSALPFMTDDNAAMTRAFYELNKGNEEFNAESSRLGLTNLAYWPAGASLFGTKVPLESTEDFEGMRVRAVGDGLLAAMEAVGASPIALTAGEMYEGVERGVIDGLANNMDAPIAYKLTEVLDYWTDTGYGHYITIGMWISQAAYDRMSPAQQEIFDSAVERLNTGEGIAAFAATAATQCDYMLDQPNVELTRWSDEEIDSFKAMTGDTAEQMWIETAKSAGIEDPEAVLEEYRGYLDEFGADDTTRVAPLADCAERFANR